jgi:nitrite reductase/ring-hydroxylating ferredoxin subunit
MLWRKNKKQWYRVFDSPDLALQQLHQQKFLRIEAGKRTICITICQGIVVAFDDVCPHMGAPLSKGTCVDDVFVECPYHRYRFDMRTGEEQKTGAKELEVFEIRLDTKGLFILV